MRSSLIQKYPVTRVPYVGDDNAWGDEALGVAVEVPLAVEIDGLGSYTVLYSPDDKRAMAVGFLFSEGIIKGIDDIDLLNDCVDSPDTIRVRLKNTPHNGDVPGRNMTVVSSCGMCGAVDMEERIGSLPHVGKTLNIDPEIMNRAMDTMCEQQDVFKKTGGTHGVLLFDSTGSAVSFAEDIGRHNALDKTIGKILLEGKTTKGAGAVLSGRVSFEMVAKCALAGIEIILAVSAPTSLAVEAAAYCGITLCAYVRNGGATVFTHPARMKR